VEETVNNAEIFTEKIKEIVRVSSKTR